MSIAKPAASVASLPPAFQRLAWSNLVAQSAEQIALAAVPIVAVLSLRAAEAETGALQTALTLPFLIFSIPAGLLADRFSRRLLMVGAEAGRTVALLAILIMIASGSLSVTWLAILGFACVCGTVTYSVAAPALVPSLVGPNHLAAANSRIELARTVAFAAGPALGGVLVGWAGGASAFGIAAALSLLAVGLLSGVTEPARPTPSKRHPLHDLKEGAAFVASHPLLRPVFVTQFIFGTAWFVIMGVFAPYAVHHLHLTASGIGIILAMYGIGMIAGALLATRILQWLPFGVVIALGPVSGFAAALLMVLTLYMPSGALAGFSFFVMGAGPILWVISTTTLRQAVTPAHLLGRVSAINILSYGARPLGSALAAVIGGASGAGPCLYVAATGFGLQALVILMSPVVTLRRQPEMCAPAPT
jgi:predicted MFS family arabinose efflux permease